MKANSYLENLVATRGEPFTRAAGLSAKLKSGLAVMKLDKAPSAEIDAYISRASLKMAVTCLAYGLYPDEIMAAVDGLHDFLAEETKHDFPN